METKICFKCSRSLPRSEFYKHSQMADGLLGKCKDCTRKDVAQRVEAKSQTDLEWILAERERHRLKAIRQRKQGRAKQSSEAKRGYDQRNPHKKRAHMLVNRAVEKGLLIKNPCEICGSEKRVEGHHDDYSKPLEVKWLCAKHHAERHRELREQEIINKFLERQKHNP